MKGLFDDLIGQPLAVDLLGAALRHRRLAPAYLFAGPEGVGRRPVSYTHLTLPTTTSV